MALSLNQTEALGRILKSGMKVASMGYPDIIAPIKDMPGLIYRADSNAICRRHGLKERQIPDAESYFELKGCELHVYDIVQERGCERLCDLNKPRELEYAKEFYDIVLDVGTIEHCFNIAQAMMNMAGLAKVGGYIIHENPFSMPNHGFYNLNPTLYADFYAANGFELLECKLASRDGGSAEVPHTKRFRIDAAEVNVFAMARRTALQAFVFPVQTKYKKLIAAQAAPAAGDRAKEKENA